MKNVIHLLSKDFRRFMNDKPAVMLTFVVPAVLIIIFGNIFGGNGGRSSVPVVFVNESESKLAKTFESKLDSSKTIRLLKYYTEGEDTTRIKYTASKAEELIKAGERSAAIVFPTDFFTDTSSTIKVRFLYDPKDMISSGIIEGSIQQTIMSSVPEVIPVLLKRQVEKYIGKDSLKLFNNKLAKDISEYFDISYDEIYSQLDSMKFGSAKNDSSSSSANILDKIIKIESEQLVGKEVKNPGLTRMVGGWAMMFMLFSLTGAATSLFEEKQEGSLKRLLCMPVSRTQILISKYIYSMIIGILQLSVLFVLAWALFNLEIFSNPFNLLLVIIASASTAVAFGMVITASAKSMSQVNGVSTLLILIMSAIGGSWFPVFLFPEWVQVISKFTITYWSVEAFLQVLWRQGNLASIYLHLIILFSIAIFANIYAILLFRKGRIF